MHCGGCRLQILRIYHLMSLFEFSQREHSPSTAKLQLHGRSRKSSLSKHSSKNAQLVTLNSANRSSEGRGQRGSECCQGTGRPKTTKKKKETHTQTQTDRRNRENQRRHRHLPCPDTAHLQYDIRIIMLNVFQTYVLHPGRNTYDQKHSWHDCAFRLGCFLQTLCC